MSLKYEPFLEQPHIYAKGLFLNGKRYSSNDSPFPTPSRHPLHKTVTTVFHVRAVCTHFPPQHVLASPPIFVSYIVLCWYPPPPSSECWLIKGQAGYRGTSLIRNSARPGPHSRKMPRALWLSWGVGLFFMSEVTLYPMPCRRFAVQLLHALSLFCSCLGLQISII